MACFREEVLYCAECEKTKELPKCCGKIMEFDKKSFFCSICERELVNIPLCCNKAMGVHYKIRNIKKEIFGTYEYNSR